MIEYVVDTSAVVTYRRRNRNAYERFEEADLLYLPVVALGELFYGSYYAQDPERSLSELDAILPVFSVVYADDETAQVFGQIKCLLRRRGTPLPENDVWIAAFALQRGMPLLGLDAHFASVEGLNYIAL